MNNAGDQSGATRPDVGVRTTPQSQIVRPLASIVDGEPLKQGGCGPFQEPASEIGRELFEVDGIVRRNGVQCLSHRAASLQSGEQMELDRRDLESADEEVSASDHQVSGASLGEVAVLTLPHAGCILVDREPER